MKYEVVVLDDILDIGERLYCECKKENFFIVCRYYFEKIFKSLLKTKVKRYFLGEYKAFKNSYRYGIEDITFLAQNITNFSPLVEALEIEQAKTLYFYFVNFPAVQDRIVKGDIMDISLSIEIKKIVKLPNLSKIDFLLEDNKELIDLASSGNYRAIEKLEEFFKDDIYKVLRYYKTKPYILFQSYMKYINKAYYEFVGIIKEIAYEKDYVVFDVEIDKYNFKAFVTCKDLDFEKGERVLIFGNLMGYI